MMVNHTEPIPFFGIDATKLTNGIYLVHKDSVEGRPRAMLYKIDSQADVDETLGLYFHLETEVDMSPLDDKAKICILAKLLKDIIRKSHKKTGGA